MSGGGNVFFPRPRNASKLSTRIDADGKEVEVEVREDEEQKIKLQEIIDLLVAAGYFRARIKGLSSFDKVIGGMTWCIETCNSDVDVDLLFQENLTIGQKIALTEKILAVLPEINCPHHIEPHKIQGLDFIHVFPVIQWLVKRSVETREEMWHFVRSFAVGHFNKSCSLPEEQRILMQQDNVLRNLRAIKEVYRPQRHFRRKDASPEEEESRVQSTVLQYGYKQTVATPVLSAESGETSQETSTVQQTERLEEQQIETLMKSTAYIAVQEGHLTAGVVGSIVNLQAHEIARAAERYAELQAKLDEEGGSSPSSHSRAVVALGRQKAALEERVVKLQEQKAHFEAAVEQESLQLPQVCVAHERVDKVLKDMASLETEENQGVLQKLQALLILNESLKQQDTDFREQCKVELGKLQKPVRDAQESATPDKDSDQMIVQFAEEKQRVQKLRLLLAKRTRSIAAL
jgi:hypothetical protein